MVWYIVLGVALAVSVLINIELYEIGKELKTELHEHDIRTAYDNNTTDSSAE